MILVAAPASDSPKKILVAAPASDSQQLSNMIQKRCTFWWIMAYMVENEPQSTKLNVMIILSKTGLFATGMRLAGTIKRYALHSYVGTIFSDEFSIIQHVLCCPIKIKSAFLLTFCVF